MIVKSRGGNIEVESEPGRGAVFTVWLPTVAPVIEGDPIVGGGTASQDRTPRVETDASEVGPRVAECEAGRPSRETRDAGQEVAA